MFQLSKKTYLIALFAMMIISCDDGDIVVSNFNFDQDTALDLCGDSDNQVLFTIDDETNEAISFTFTNQDFDGTLKA